MLSKLRLRSLISCLNWVFRLASAATSCFSELSRSCLELSGRPAELFLEWASLSEPLFWAAAEFGLAYAFLLSFLVDAAVTAVALSVCIGFYFS